MAETIYTISEITRVIKKCLEENPELNSIWIKGEISNLTYHSSGHIYLSLKDNDAVISSVYFKYANKNLKFKLEEGMSILAFGSINIFEKRGSYQFIIADVRLEGVGELLKRIEQLKKRLLIEGIFDQSHKKKIPYLPKRIGIVTSPTGAAVRDIIKVAMRRFPDIEIILAPVKVQGPDAALSIVRGIEELNKPEYGADVIIAGRGGGSFEDLLAFSEEIVVRAFFNSRLPIISAVVHQIDHPLSDDAADYAAATPSAAAEIAVPVKEELAGHINDLFMRSANALNYCMRAALSKIERFADFRAFRNPMEIVNNRELILSDIENRMTACLNAVASHSRNRLMAIPDINRLIKNLVKDRNHALEIVCNNIDGLSPVGILSRGYSIVMDAKDRVVRSIKGLEKGDDLNIILKDGSVVSSVNSISSEVYFGKKRESAG